MSKFTNIKSNNPLFNPISRIKITHFVAILVLSINAVFLTDNAISIAIQIFLAVVVYLHNIDDAILGKLLSKQRKDLENNLSTIDELFSGLKIKQAAIDDSLIYCEINKHGNIIFSSKAFEKISQYSKDALLEQSYMIDKHPDVNKSIYDDINKTIKEEKVWKGEIKNLSKEGNTYITSTTIHPVYDKDDIHIGYRIVKEDISEIQNLLKLKEKQADELLIIQTELKSSLKEEKFAKEAKDIFFANVSHDIRTPLNGIIGTLDLVKNDSLSEKQLEYIKLCQNSSSLLLDLVNNILDINKLQAGKLELDLHNSNMVNELQELKKLFKQDCENQNTTLLFNFDKNIPLCLMSDIKRLKHVIINLLSNSVKFTKNGNVNFNLNIINKSNENLTLRFIIEDTGIGISKEMIKNIFEPYTQENSSTSTNYGGTGLGTVIAKNIVELYGGKIDIQSELNSGTKISFDIQFGICDKAQKEVEIITEVSFKDNNILVADDNETNRILIDATLEQFNLITTLTNDGSEVYDEYINNISKYELILMDINMPIIDGTQALGNIRAYEKENNIQKQIPIIALTANAMSGDKQKFLDLGFDDYLTKPISRDELRRVLNYYININN